MSTKGLKKRLFQEHGGRCHWCSKELTLAEGTVDHLRDKFHPLRYAPDNGEKLHVLACEPCNDARGKASQAEFWCKGLWRSLPADHPMRRKVERALR